MQALVERHYREAGCDGLHSTVGSSFHVPARQLRYSISHHMQDAAIGEVVDGSVVEDATGIIYDDLSKHAVRHTVPCPLLAS